MNVLIVPSWYTARPGAQLGSFFREQALALKETGCDVFVADTTLQSMHSLHGKRIFRLQTENDEGLITYSYLMPSFGLMRMPKLAMYAYSHNLEKVFHKIIKDGIKIDVIHAHSFFPAGVAATRIGKKYNIPVAVTEHSSTIISKKLTPQKVDWLKETVANCDAFICVGNGLKKAVVDYTHTDAQISVIPNIVDKRFTYKEVKDSDAFSFVSVGNLIPSKRFDLTIRAFATSFKGKKKITLTIIGDGPLKEKLQALANELGVEDQVVFKGRLDRNSVVDELQKSNVFILASDYETFGVVYIEALACGLPIIGTRNGGAEDIINDNNGVLVDTDSEQQIGDAMRYLFDNCSDYDKFEVAQQCKKDYGGETICAKIMSAYNCILYKQAE